MITLSEAATATADSGPGLTPASHGILIAEIALGMLVVVPLGLRLLDLPGLDPIRRYWPAAALPGVASLLVPPGLAAGVPVGGVLAGGYAAGTLILLTGLPEVARRGDTSAAVRAAAATALVAPTVASVALLAERTGYRLLGFRPAVLTLTVAHFHYAGFAAALVASLAGRALPTDPRATLGALTVPAGTVIVLAGFFLSDWVELAGAMILTTGLWLTGWVTWRQIRPRSDRWGRRLFTVSAGTLPASMLLALSWALGSATGLPHPSLSWMVATHGVANATGFVLCALLAWRRLAATP
jgi:hypothetical protein